MASKKYYWLKLQKDFFKRHDIRIIEEMPNGKDYILFYMKLLVESISHEGHLRFSEAIPYNEEMLSTITHTNIDIVRSAVKIFTELNLMNFLDDGTLYMNETSKMMGVETDWAKKKRAYRGQKKTLSDKSIELEKELELDKEIDKEIDNKKPKKETKNKYGEYKHVLLTKTEYNKLIADWNESEVLRMIKDLDEGIELKGYKYKSHNLALRKWKSNETKKETNSKWNSSKGVEFKSKVL